MAHNEKMTRDDNMGDRLSHRDNTNVIPRLFCLFVLSSLYFLTVDVLADARVAIVIGQDAVIPVHLLYLLLQTAGFLLYYPIQKSAKAETLRKITVCVVFALSGFSLLGFLLAQSYVLIVVFIGVCLLASGTIGALAYYHAAVGMSGNDSLGQFCGFGIAAAALLQIFTIASPLPIMGRALVLLLALCIALVLVLIDDPETAIANETPKQTASTPPGVRYCFILIAIVAVISFIGGMNDGILTQMNAESQLDLYAFPRLFYLAGVIAAGFIADYRDGRYLGLVMFSAILCSIIGLLFVGDPNTMFANACIYSLLAGFSIIFFTVPFMRLAVRTTKPALWASMGRAVRLPFMAIGTILMSSFLGSMPLAMTLGLSIFLCIVLIVLFWSGGFFAVPTSMNAIATRESINAQAIDAFAAMYGLTSREEEILTMLYQGLSTSQIGNKLFISEKTVRNHISNTMSKTGTSSRTELLVNALKGSDK